TPGIVGRWQPNAFPAQAMANNILPPTPRKYELLSERETLLLCGKAQVRAKAAELPLVRRTKSHLRVRRQMPQNGRSPHSATPLGLRSTIVSSLEYASAGTSGPDPRWGRGWYARNQEPNA